jgi:hypothetical protein
VLGPRIPLGWLMWRHEHRGEQNPFQAEVARGCSRKSDMA